MNLYSAGIGVGSAVSVAGAEGIVGATAVAGSSMSNTLVLLLVPGRNAVLAMLKTIIVAAKMMVIFWMMFVVLGAPKRVLPLA
jgi:hypothetical protein